MELIDATNDDCLVKMLNKTNVNEIIKSNLNYHFF